MSTTETTTDQIEEKIQVYASALGAIAENDTSREDLNDQNILSILLARDQLQNLLTQNYLPSSTQALAIADLDDRLLHHRDGLLRAIKLGRLHKALSPSEDHWWWFISQPEPIIEIVPEDKFDWIFNSLSLLFLAGFGSLTTQIIPIIFADGLGIFESVGLMGPGALLTIIGTNIKGGENRDKFMRNMEKIGIPQKFCSEATCLLAASLFGVAYIARQALPSYYFNQLVRDGVQLYQQSRLVPAEEKLRAALKLPDLDQKEVGKVWSYIGVIQESIGHNPEAIEAYERAILLGNKQSINNVARVYIAKADLLTAETYLKLGLQRANQSQEAKNPLYQYHLYRNLGWVYLEAKRYKEAETVLETAREFSNQSLTKEFLGQGMASCFLGAVYEKTDRVEQAKPIWERCIKRGKPETIQEYRAIVKFKPELADDIDTKGLF
ncbi:MAG: tetratricopeptide repeat protein [Pseudanabaena sp. ELA645]|jgi:tetratricopeptide (TPR) repeat protein